MNPWPPKVVLDPGRVGHAIRFNGGELSSHVWIRPPPPSDSCELGVGRRRFCVIRHMLNPPRHSAEAGFAEKSVRFSWITLTVSLDAMRFLRAEGAVHERHEGVSRILGV